MENVSCRICGTENEYRIIEKTGQKTAWCLICQNWIKNISYTEPTLWFGKFSGTPVKKITDLSYLGWLIKDAIVKPGRIKRAIESRIIELRRDGTRELQKI